MNTLASSKDADGKPHTSWYAACDISPGSALLDKIDLQRKKRNVLEKIMLWSLNKYNVSSKTLSYMYAEFTEEKG